MIYAINKRTKEHVVYREDGSQPEIAGSADWKFVEADADGWIPWDSRPGAECPLSESDKCDAWVWKGSAGEAMIVSGYRAADLLREHGARNIITYRPTLNAEPSEPEAPEWDGESWPPPIGCKITTKGLGYEAKVIAVEDGHVIGWCSETTVCGTLQQDHCRPIRTSAQRAEKEAMHGMCAVMADALGTSSPDWWDVAKAIYAAIRDGKIPGVKLEGE